MKQYLELLNQVLQEGTWQGNRTGIPTLRIDGGMLQFDLEKGFPAVTTKQLAFSQVKGELLGFIRGYSNACDFRELGCKVWDQNANENYEWLANKNRQGRDDLGRIYGVQWRRWDTERSYIDQLANAIHLIQTNPENRRIIVTAWNPSDMDKMALPPCHLLFQFLVNVEKNELSMCMYQRSCDMFLGIPFNIASYALLLEIVAAATGRRAKRLTMFLADIHIYKNHIPQVETQLTRPCFPLPNLQLVVPKGISGIQYLTELEPGDIQLVGYAHHPSIKGEMAV